MVTPDGAGLEIGSSDFGSANQSSARQTGIAITSATYSTLPAAATSITTIPTIKESSSMIVSHSRTLLDAQDEPVRPARNHES